MTAPCSSPSRRCGVCECLPDAPSASGGRMHLWFPGAHVLAKATAHARRTGLAAQPIADAVGLTLDVDAASVDAVARGLAGALTALEADDTRVLLTGGSEPTASDIARVSSLSRFHALCESSWLLEVLDANRLTTHFQPIVLAADPGHVVAHEALLRATDAQGASVMPGRLFGAAERAGLLFQLDLAARRTAIAAAAAHALGGQLFINFAPTAIYDPATCLRSTVAAIDAAGIAHDRVVFEVVETDGIGDLAHLRTILDYYRGAGFRVALDDVGAGYSSLNRLHQLRPDLVKLDMELVRDVHADAYKAVVAEKVIELADSLGIPVLAEGVETAEELAWLQRRAVRYVQGYHVGRPSATPRAVGVAAGASPVGPRPERAVA